MESRIFILVLGAVLLAHVCPSSQVPKNNAYQDQTVAAATIDENSESSPNQHEEDDYYQEFLGVPMPSPTDDFGVKGRPGIDFPNLAAIPITSFTCRNVKESGYFADMETKCQVFHICDGGRKMSFLCPNGTIFRQSHLICDWWFRVDCEDSQNYYEPSADTLRRDREKSKYDRLASESRESMSITTNYRPPPTIQQYVQPNAQGNGNTYYEPGQPLHPSNRRISTVEEQVINDEERNSRVNQNRKSISVTPRPYPQKQINSHESPNSQRDLAHKKIIANFRSVADNGYSTDSDGIPKLVIEDGIVRAVKQAETDDKSNVYFEPDNVSKSTFQPSNTNSESVNSQGNSWNSDNDDVNNRRADKMRRVIRLKVKSNKSVPNEGQILAETSSYASSHRRGLTQDRRLETVTFSQLPESIPFFDINSAGKASNPSTVSSIQNVATTPASVKPSDERVETTTKSVLPKNRVAALLRNSEFLEEDSIMTYRPPSQKGDSNENLPENSKDGGSPESNNKENGEDMELAVTMQPYVDEDLIVTYRPVMDLEKFLNHRREMLTKNDDKRDGKPYTGNRTSPILPLSSSPGAVRSLALYIESLSEDLIHSTPRRIHGNLRGIIPTDPTPIQKPGSSLHVERESLYSTQKQQARQQQSSKTTNSYETVSFVKYNDQQTGIKSKNDSKETNESARKTSEKTDGNSYVVNEPVFQNLQWNAKDSNTNSNKHQNSKAENNKKSDVSSKKMKDYLLGNFTSEDSGLFQHINKALTQSNASLTKYSMETLFKNAIEPVLKEAMTLGSITESELSEILTTTEDSEPHVNTEYPSYTEKYNGNENTLDKETIQITPFFKVENGKVTSTSSKFPKDEDLSKTPSDLRELAQVFSRALSAYLEDPETFRDALASVSHPRNPNPPIRLTSGVNENKSNVTRSKEDEDEVLDFSDVQTPTTTGLPLFQNPTTSKIPSTTTSTPYYSSDTPSSKIQTGFYITIPFITPTQKIPEREATSERFGDHSHQDAEGPGSDGIQSATTKPVNILIPFSNGSSLNSLPLLRPENNSQQFKNNLSHSTELSKGEDGALLEENFPPLETKILPPFQDAIPGHEGLTSKEEETGFTDINIPTAALDEILNEFVPEELNRLAMTSIESDEIPDDKKYTPSYTESLEPNHLSTTDLLKENVSTTSITSNTTPLVPTTDLASQTVNSILSRITAKLPQMTNPRNSGNSHISTVTYDTYANHLLKTVRNPITEQDESLIQAQSASFLPSQPNSKNIPKQITNKQTSSIEDFHSSITEQNYNEKPTPFPNDNTDYELIPRSSTVSPVGIDLSRHHTKIFNATELLSLNGGDDRERSQHGNPRLVLLFVNDHNAKGIGLNEKNARLLKALLRKDDHHILHSVGLIPEDEGTREPTTSTTMNNLQEGTSLAPPSRLILSTPSTTIQSKAAQQTNLHSNADNPDRTEPPITTYAPKFTIPWFPIKKVKSSSRNHTARAEKLQATDPPESTLEMTTSISTGSSNAPKYLPEKQASISLSNSTELLGEDKSTVSDGRAFDLLRSLYSLTARWG